MKKLLLITIIFLFQSLPSYSSELIDKGFVCENTSKKKKTPFTYKGYWFVSNSSYEWWGYDVMDVDNDGDKFEFYKVFDSKSTHYHMTEDDLFLRVRSIGDRSILDNPTLVISRYNLKLKHYSENKIVAVSICKIFNNKNNFLQRLEEIADYFRIKNEKKLKKRKF